MEQIIRRLQTRNTKSSPHEINKQDELATNGIINLQTDDQLQVRSSRMAVVIHGTAPSVTVVALLGAMRNTHTAVSSSSVAEPQR